MGCARTANLMEGRSGGRTREPLTANGHRMSLTIGVALLTYSRPAHARRVLEGLRREGITEFTVYMDGADTAEVRAKQTEMAAEMAAIDWADCKIVRRDENVGLARSVVGAVTDQLEQYD